VLEAGHEGPERSGTRQRPRERLRVRASVA
jgi:hypothetical protein